MPHLASWAMDAKTLSSCDTLRTPFFLTEMLIILNPCTFFPLHLNSYVCFSSLCQLRLAALFGRSPWKQKCTADRVCALLCTRTQSPTQSYIYARADSGYVRLLGLAFYSPVERPSIREGWGGVVKEALGVFLSWSLFLRYKTRLTHWWIPQVEQIVFSVFMKGGCGGTWGADPMENSPPQTHTLIWQGTYSMYSISAVPQTQTSGVWAPSRCVDITYRDEFYHTFVFIPS